MNIELKSIDKPIPGGYQSQDPMHDAIGGFHVRASASVYSWLDVVDDDDDDDDGD